jgi:hypothetical protein
MDGAIALPFVDVCVQVRQGGQHLPLKGQDISKVPKTFVDIPPQSLRWGQLASDAGGNPTVFSGGTGV